MRVNLTRLGSITEVASGTRTAGIDLAAEVERRTAVLGLRAIGRGNHAIIVHGGTASFFADLLAVWQAGACAVCVDPRLTAGELATIVDFVQPAAVLAGDADVALDRPAPVLRLANERATTGHAQPAHGDLDDAALILFTSGTTGDPKGVVHSFRSLLARIALNTQAIGVPTLAKTLCVLPTYFGHGLIGNCLTPLLTGAHLLLWPGVGVKTAGSLASVIEEHDVTFMSSVPSFWKLALKLGRAPRAQHLRQVNIGSAPLSAELWRAVMAWAGTDNVVNAYGITETANWAASASARDFAPDDGLVGKVWGGSAALLGADGRMQGEDSGEILLQTPSLMSGYHRRPDLTATVLREGWFHTGDTGTIDGDGVIRLIGRRKHEINRAGQKVHPEEIDALLERHPDVAEACTFGVPDAVSGELVAAAVCLRDGSALGEAELRRWCLERVRRELAPERWFFLANLPKTGRGKVDRRAVIAACTGAGAP